MSEDGDLPVDAEPPRYTLEELVPAMRPEDAPEILDDPKLPPVGGEFL